MRNRSGCNFIELLTIDFCAYYCQIFVLTASCKVQCAVSTEFCSKQFMKLGTTEGFCWKSSFGCNFYPDHYINKQAIPNSLSPKPKDIKFQYGLLHPFQLPGVQKKSFTLSAPSRDDSGWPSRGSQGPHGGLSGGGAPGMFAWSAFNSSLIHSRVIVIFILTKFFFHVYNIVSSIALPMFGFFKWRFLKISAVFSEQN